MAAAPEPLLMTVEEYRRLGTREDCIEELHWGQLVQLSFPKSRHVKLQARLARLLRPKLERWGIVETEVPFRGLPEYELRGADVAFISQQRWDDIPDEDNLHGSPELVIEVLSPSNTTREMREKSALCLTTGAREFWIVDPDTQTITVTTASGEASVYTQAVAIPLQAFGGDALSVSAVFD